MDSAFGPWNPGIESQIPNPLLALATLYRSEHARTPLRDVREIADLTGLPLRDIVAFRPERLALHELLVRVTADISVPDGTRIEDLGINFRRITSTMLERDIMPRMDAIRTAYTRAREAIGETVSGELGRLYAPPPAPVPREGWLARLRGSRAIATPPPTSERELIAEWETRAREVEGAERAALRALSRLVSALVVRHERVWADRGLVAVSKAIAAADGRDPDEVYLDLGRHSARVNLAGAYDAFSPEVPHHFFELMDHLHRTFQSFGRSEYVRTGERSGRIRLEGYLEFSPVYCRSGLGYYEQSLAMMKVPGPIQVAETSCQCRGQEACVFELSW